MATGVVVWSQNAASNATADAAANWPEGMPPSQVNDSARGSAASIAKWRDDLNGTISTSGTSTAYVVATNQTFASLTAGYEVTFQVDETNGPTVTLNVDGKGAKPLRSAPGVELVAGALPAGSIHRATYKTSNSGEWILQNVTPTLIAADQVVTASILNGAVTYAKIQDVSATKRALGRNTAGAGDAEEVTAAQIINWLGTPARGDMIRQGASDPERLAKGSAGQVLTMGADDPAWAEPSRRLIATLIAANSATLSDTTSFTSSYKFYEVEFLNLLPATNTVGMTLQIRSGGSFKSSGYAANIRGRYILSSSADTDGTSGILLSVANDIHNAGPGVSGKLRFYNPSANQICSIFGDITYKYYNSNILFVGVSGGGWMTAGVVDGFQILCSSGNIATGQVNIYGYN